MCKYQMQTIECYRLVSLKFEMSTFSKSMLICDLLSYLTVWLLNLTSNYLSCFNQVKIMQRRKNYIQVNFLKLCSLCLPSSLVFFFLTVLFIFIISRLIDHRFTISVGMFPTENSFSLFSPDRYPATGIY